MFLWITVRNYHQNTALGWSLINKTAGPKDCWLMLPLTPLLFQSLNYLVFYMFFSKHFQQSSCITDTAYNMSFVDCRWDDIAEVDLTGTLLELDSAQRQYCNGKFKTWTCEQTKQTIKRVGRAKTQISLGIRPVWSESFLSAWRRFHP